eukprot:m.7520 g.7520  ORF g.7520 m.7520 type:complete len:462 (-) comp5258_c0_seq1:195-1580(-)
MAKLTVTGLGAIAMVVVLAASMQVCNADAAMDCMDTFILSKEPVCDKLRALDECLSGSTQSEFQSRAYRALFAARAKNTQCDYTHKTESDIAVDDEGLHIHVPRDVRVRREASTDPMSLWDLEDKVAEIKAKARFIPTHGELEAYQNALNTALDREGLASAAATAVNASVRANIDTLLSVEADAQSLVLDATRSLATSGVQVNDLRRMDDVVFTQQAQNTLNEIGDATNEALVHVSATSEKMGAWISEQQEAVDTFGAEFAAMLDDSNSHISQSITELNERRQNLTNLLTKLRAHNANLQQNVNQLKSVRASRTASLTPPSSDYPIISGYCNHHGTVSGVNYYCMSNVEFNSVSDYIVLESTDIARFRVVKAGYVRVNFFVISSVCNWAHMILYVNGQSRYYGHEHTYGSWSDNFMDTVWKMEVNDYFEPQVRTSCGSYAYHSGNQYGQHSRLQVEWLGPA